MRRKSFVAPSAGAPAPEWAAPPQTGLVRDEATLALTGDLSDKPINWLLMAAQHYEVTGKLQIGLAACPVIIHFGLGRAVHAQSPFCVGAEAIMDLFIWKDGKVRFEHGNQPDSVTVQESADDLVRRGLDYARNKWFLEEHNISEMSFLVRPAERHVIGELEKRLKQGQPLDTNLQMEFYSNIYGTRNIKDTAEKLSLGPSQWVSIAANLLQLGILLTPDGRSIQTTGDRKPAHAADVANTTMQKSTDEFQSLRLPQSDDKTASTAKPLTNLWQTKATVHKTTELPSEVTITPASLGNVAISDHIVTLDAADHNRVLTLLSSPETGIFTFDAFQFFIAREYARACRFKSLLTLVLFSIRQADRSTVSPEVPTLVTATVSRIKRDVDVFGHFGSRAYALLLPNVDSSQACLLVDRINRDLLQISPDLINLNVKLHFGLASVPQDSSELNGLVKAAQVAMFHATSNQLLRTQAMQLRN